MPAKEVRHLVLRPRQVGDGDIEATDLLKHVYDPLVGNLDELLLMQRTQSGMVSEDGDGGSSFGVETALLQGPHNRKELHLRQ